MGYYRRNRAYRRRAGRGPVGILFLVFLFLAIFVAGGHFLLPLLFVGFAFASLFASLFTMNPRGIYGGIQSFVWCLGLALCFAVGFWPWILLPIIASAILGSLIRPITAALLGLGIFGAVNMMNQSQQQQQPYYQPSTPYYQPTPSPEQPPQDSYYQPYQQGYQPPAPSIDQQEQPQYYYPQNQPPQQSQQYNQGQSYEEPQAQYPQEMPPPQQ